MDPSTTIGIGAAISALVALLKTAIPGLQPRVLPVLVLVLAAVLVVGGALAGRGSLDVYDLVLRIIAQAAASMGLRESVVTAMPAASAGFRAAGRPA